MTKLLHQLARRPLLVSYLICPLVLACVFGLWRARVFQGIECALYDQVIEHRSPRDATLPGIAIIGINEQDIRRYGWALDDEKLALLLEQLAAQHPSVIALDLYRDLPEPRSGQYSQILSNTLVRHTNIVCIYGAEANPPIDPPQALAGRIDQQGFNQFPADADGVIRRALFYPLPAHLPTPENQIYSLAFQVARIYLAQHGIALAYDRAAPRQLRVGKSILPTFESNDGPYVQDENIAGFQMLLDYRGGRDIPTYSMNSVMSGALSNSLTGRIVLIGTVTGTLKDFMNTPFRDEQAGVVVHAQVIDQVLRLAEGASPTAQFWPEWLEALWIIAWGLLGRSLAYSTGQPLRLAYLGIGALAGLTAVYIGALFNDWWLPLTPAAIAFIACSMLVVSYVSFAEKSMRNMLMKLFSRQVSKDIAVEIWSHRDEILDGHRPRPQKLTVTVLFTDLKGFSSIAEQMEPTELYAWLNLYLGEMANLVERNGGVLKQFTGDGLMANFGVPTPHLTRAEQAKDAENAIRCALAMGRRLQELNRDWERAGLKTVSMRVGIYTGEVAAGSIGSADRFEYALVGDVVNTAARLEQYNKDLSDPDQHPLRCRILIGAPTKELVEGQFDTQHVGLLKLKGKEIEVAVFQVHGEITRTVKTV